MAQIAAACLAAVHRRRVPTVMQMDSWQELSNPRDLTKDFPNAGIRGLARVTRFRGFALHRFGDAAVLARTPYGRRPIRSGVRFRGGGGRRRSQQILLGQFGLCDGHQHHPRVQDVWLVYPDSRHRIRRCGGEPADHIFPTDDGGVDAKCPTEIAISDRREAELAKNGFMPLIHKKNSDFAAFIGAQSLQKPAEYDDPDATASANLSARLPICLRPAASPTT